jgi:hypothetical protein
MVKMLVTVALAVVCSFEGLGQPKISSQGGTDLKFGEAFAGNLVERKIIIQNTGSDTLHIKGVRAQCGCTATLINQRALAPSDTTSLTITFNTRGYNGKAKKHVYVDSDDPATPQLTIAFETNVITALALSPMFISMQLVKPDSLAHSVINIVNQYGESVEITGVKVVLDTIAMNITTPAPPAKEEKSWEKLPPAAQKPSLRASIDKKDLKPGEKTELTVEFKSPKPGNFQGTIFLTTNLKQIPQYDVRFFANVR